MNICTANDPWSEDKGYPTIHPDAIDEGECFDGCCDKYRCPNCGLRFTVEAGQ